MMVVVVHDMTFKEEFSLFFGRGNGWRRRVALRVVLSPVDISCA